MRRKIINILCDLRLSFLLKLLYRLFGCKFNIQKNSVLSFDHNVLIDCRFDIIGINNQVILEKDCFFESCSIKIRGNNNRITIGKKSFASNLNIVIEDDNNEIFIDEGFFVCGNTRLYVVGSSKLTFGKDCMLSDNIEIRTTDNHAIYDLSSGKRINPEKDICFGTHVWIGMGVTVLKGVSVADGCVLGAKSIITKSIFEPNCCVVGNNQIVRTNIKWTMER